MSPFSFRLCTGVAVSLAVCWSPVWAQPAAAPPSTSPGLSITLAQAVDAAWRRAVSAADADGGRQRAEARRSVAGSLLAGAPALELSHRAGQGDSRESEVATALPLALPGLRHARQASGDADVALAEAQRRHTRWQIAGQVREATWAIEAARADEAQAQAHAATLEQVAGDVERRVRAGDLARADHLAARSEALAAQAVHREAALKLADAQRHWVTLTGLPVPSSALATEGSDTSTPESHPALESATRSLEQARRNADLVAATRRDPPELRVGLRQEADGPGTSRTSAGIGVRIPFGADVHNRPREADAWTAVNLAQRQSDSARQRVEADLAQAQAAIETAQARLQAEEARNSLTSERSELVRKAFDAGDMSLPELLRVLTAASTAQADLARARAALGLAQARLAHAQGITP
jgi:cobalt-zinc-cadmium efflux system outer membrane protein